MRFRFICLELTALLYILPLYGWTIKQRMAHLCAISSREVLCRGGERLLLSRKQWKADKDSMSECERKRLYLFGLSFSGTQNTPGCFYSAAYSTFGTIIMLLSWTQQCSFEWVLSPKDERLLTINLFCRLAIIRFGWLVILIIIPLNWILF